MIFPQTVGKTVHYIGGAMGQFPPSIEYVEARLISLCGEAAVLETAPGYLWGVLAEDCHLPELQAELSPVARNHKGSWTK